MAHTDGLRAQPPLQPVMATQEALLAKQLWLPPFTIDTT